MTYLTVGGLALLLPVFATSAWSKLRNRAAWSGFVRSVRDLRLVPARAARPVAAGVATAEVAVVLLLAVPETMPLGLVLAAVLLSGFTVAIWSALRRGVPARCRCFGAAGTQLGGRHLVRNGLLLAVAAQAGVSGWLAPPASPEPAGLVVAIAAGLVGAVVVIYLDQFVELFREQGRA